MMGILIEQIATLYDSVIGVWFVMKLCGGNIKESKYDFDALEKIALDNITNGIKVC